MTIKIDKDIPMPLIRGTQLPWEAMEVGDSFFLSDRPNGHSYSGIANKRLAPKRFSGRKVEGGYRIWRVE